MAALSGSALLVIEDSASIAELLRLSLADEGAVVHHATHGFDALRRLDAGLRPDALILDLILPDVDGRDLLGAVLDRGLGIPLLLLSGWPGAAAVAEHFGIPLLRKPFDLDELLETVAAMVGTSSLSS